MGQSGGPPPQQQQPTVVPGPNGGPTVAYMSPAAPVFVPIATAAAAAAANLYQVWPLTQFFNWIFTTRNPFVCFFTTLKFHFKGFG